MDFLTDMVSNNYITNQSRGAGKKVAKLRIIMSIAATHIPKAIAACGK